MEKIVRTLKKGLWVSACSALLVGVWPTAHAENISLTEPVNIAAPVLPPLYVEQIVTLKPNQALATRLKQTALTSSQVNELVYALNQKHRLNRLQAGQEFLLRYRDDGHGKADYIEELSFHTKNDKTVKVGWNDSAQRYIASIDERFIKRERTVAIGEIQDSLYMSAKRAGLPAALVPSFANLFAWELDFTRDIHPGNTFRVIYETLYDENGDVIRSGNILAAELTTKIKTHNAFRVESGGRGEYYDAQGYNKRRSLLRTPLEFARISSHFNPKRKHPVLGYTRAHKGTDFAAPRGTPIRAAGDGVIERASWYGGYGRYIRIKHAGGFQTAYAHMKKYARGMSAGKRVKQGQIIGYVGTSGRSTGPHLHYEVLKHGRHVNAMRVKLPNGKPLPGSKKGEFTAYVAEARMLWDSHNMIAEADIKP